MLQCPRCSNPLIVGRCACSGCTSPTVSRMQVMGGDVASGSVLQYSHPSTQVLSYPSASPPLSGVLAYPSAPSLAYPSPTSLTYPSPTPLSYPSPSPLAYPTSLSFPSRAPLSYASPTPLSYPPLPPLFVRYQNIPGGSACSGPSPTPSVPVSPPCGPQPGSTYPAAPTAANAATKAPQKTDDTRTQSSSDPDASEMLYGSSVCGVQALEATAFIQQAHQKDKELLAQQAQLAQQLQLIQLHRSVLQNQLQQNKLQHEVEELHRAQLSHHPLKNTPPDPLPLLTSTVSSSMTSMNPCSFSQPPTPAIMVGAMSPFFQSPPHLTFTVSGTLPSWTTPISSHGHLPLFTPPPEIPLPRPLPDSGEVLARTKAQLEESGWYHHSLSWQESSMLLQDTQEGTFLVRDSQDPRFLYSLSVQRAKEGPTSVRIHFSAGKFRLDAEEKIRELMPVFDSVGELVEYYVTSSHKTRDVFMDHNDISMKVHSPIVLRWPLYKQPPSLRHLSRLVINNKLKVSGKREVSKTGGTGGKMDTLELPAKLLEYINSYQLSI